MRIGISVFTIGVLAVVYCVFAADDKPKKSAPAQQPGPAASTRSAEKAPPADRQPAKKNAAPDSAPTTEKKPAETEKSAHQSASSNERYADDEAKLLKAADAFVKAYAQRDAKTVAALFTEDAEYVDMQGEVFVGRQAIEQTLAQYFRDNPKCTLELDIVGIRFLSPVLAIEDGVTICSTGQPGKPSDESRYTAIHSKTGNDWQVASVREMGNEGKRQHAHHLQQLDWLIGNWVDEDDDSVVHFDCRRSDDGVFLIRNFEISLGGEKVLTGTQRIGWDPIAGKLRAWTFDSQGGFFEGYWHRDGDDWVLTSNGVTADGETASGRSVFSHDQGHVITWQAVDREIGGSRLADSELFTLVRRGPMPEETGSGETGSGPAGE